MGIQVDELAHQVHVTEPGLYEVRVRCAGTTETRLWVDHDCRSRISNFRLPLTAGWFVQLDLKGGEVLALESDGQVLRFDVVLMEDS